MNKILNDWIRTKQILHIWILCMFFLIFLPLLPDRWRRNVKNTITLQHKQPPDIITPGMTAAMLEQNRNHPAGCGCNPAGFRSKRRKPEINPTKRSKPRQNRTAANFGKISEFSSIFVLFLCINILDGLVNGLVKSWYSPSPLFWFSHFTVLFRVLIFSCSFHGNHLGVGSKLVAVKILPVKNKTTAASPNEFILFHSVWLSCSKSQWIQTGWVSLPTNSVIYVKFNIKLSKETQPLAGTH